MKVNMMDDKMLNVFLVLMILTVIIVGVFAVKEIHKSTERFETEMNSKLIKADLENGIVKTVDEADFRKLDLKIVSELSLNEIEDELKKFKSDSGNISNILDYKGFYLSKTNNIFSKTPLNSSFEILIDDKITTFTLEDGTKITGIYNVFSFEIFANKDGSLVSESDYNKLSKWDNKKTKNKIKFYVEDSIDIRNLNLKRHNNYKTSSSEYTFNPMYSYILYSLF